MPCLRRTPVRLVCVDVSFAAPEDCADIQGIYAHDLTDYTGQGTPSPRAAHDRSGVVDDPETQVPSLGRGARPVGEEMRFVGSFFALNGRNATMDLSVTSDTKGAATGEMALTSHTGSGETILAGTAVERVTAEGSAMVTEVCTHLQDGQLIIPERGDESIAAFDLICESR